MRAFAWWSVVVGWMGVIFVLSAQTGGTSSGLSDMVVLVVRQVSGGLLAHVDDEVLQLVVRKCGHLSAYLVLGALVSLAWWRWPGPRHRVRPSSRTTDGQQLGPARRGPRRWWVSDWSRLGPVLVSIAYAATDEYHQSFVAGRSPQVTDVLIDTAGALFGVGLVVLLTRRTRRRRIWAADAGSPLRPAERAS